jgi:hypothetical protein
MRRVFRDPALQQAYDPTGYATVPMLSPAEVKAILGELALLRPDDNFSPVHRQGKGFTYHCSFIDSNRSYRRQVHSLITRFFAPHIERCLQGFRILNGNFYVKPPHSGEFVVHQNWPAIDDIDDTTVTVWCPLVDVVRKNGALQVVAGSHKLLPHVETLNTPAYFKDFVPALIDKYLQPVPMKAGEAIVFDDGLIHWSANNDSDLPRIAIQILCIPVDSRPAYWMFDPAHPERFELIEADTEFFLTNDMKHLRERQADWKTLGFAPNRNRTITEAEFAALLKDGDRIRRELAARWSPKSRHG